MMVTNKVKTTTCGRLIFLPSNDGLEDDAMVASLATSLNLT